MALAVTSGSIEQQRGQLASHQLPRMRTTQKPRKEEARAHIGLLSHGYYYYIYHNTLLFLSTLRVSIKNDHHVLYKTLKIKAKCYYL
jgi:hypothetical protein